MRLYRPERAYGPQPFQARDGVVAEEDAKVDELRVGE
jgi:hypothetical protein